MRRALPFIICGLVALVPQLVWGSDAPPSETTIPISTGAGGLGLGGGLAYWLLHGRVKAAETALASLAPQLPALVVDLRNAIDDFKAAVKAQREQEVQLRGKIHDVRDRVQQHEGRFIRLEERFNGLRDVVVDLKGTDAGVPRPMTDDPTGPMDVDTGRHRSVRGR